VTDGSGPPGRIHDANNARAESQRPCRTSAVARTIARAAACHGRGALRSHLGATLSLIGQKRMRPDVAGSKIAPDRVSRRSPNRERALGRLSNSSDLAGFPAGDCR
jgi:hypothetical protein